MSEPQVSQRSLSTAAKALHALLDDDAVLRGYEAVRKMRLTNPSGKRAQAEAFRRALLGITERQERNRGAE